MSPSPTTVSPPLDTALDLWRALATRAGIELNLKHGREGRDYDLPDAILDEVLKRTGVDRRGQDLADVLAREPHLISTELLLRSALSALRPFGTMMSDVIATLSAAGARSDGGSLRVRFGRGDGNDTLDQTLDAFREAIELISRALVLAEPLLPTAAMLDQMYDVLNELGGQVQSWERVARHTAPLPPLQTSGSKGADGALDGVLSAVNVVRSWLHDHGVGADQRGDFFSDRREQRDKESGNAALVAQADLAQRCTDYLDGVLYEKADDVRRKVEQHAVDPAAVVEALAPVLAQMPRAQRWVQTATRALTDILNLPVWEKRSELYAVWIGCRLLRTVGANAHDLCLHAPEGVLSFGFGGALLATYTRDRQRYEVWTELQADMAHGTLFKERSRAIQPDFRVVAGTPADRNDATRLVVECKHYLLSKPKNFVAAADDYARNCVNAAVLLVNHGALNPTSLRAQLQSQVHERVQFLGDVVPDAAGIGVAPMEEAVARILFPASGPAAQATDAVRVYWTLDADFDLSLVHIAPDGVRTQVYYGSKGALQEHPFALLEEDVRTGPGMEVIGVQRWLPGTYEVSVSDYGGKLRLQLGGVSCVVVYEGIEVQIPFPLHAGPANNWCAARIDTAKRTVQILNL